MKCKTYCLFTFLLLLVHSSNAQWNKYQFRREISSNKKEWNKISVPEELFEKIKANGSDLRVMGITSKQDTLEIPYLFKSNSTIDPDEEHRFQLINPVSNSQGYFYTFELPQVEHINKIDLHFKQQNFDWKVKLEGSNNQTEWYTIVEEYRVMSIKNEHVNYLFSTLFFNRTKYRYYRLSIPAMEVKPELLSAKLISNHHSESAYVNRTLSSTKIHHDKALKRTIVSVDLKYKVPVSKLAFSVKNRADYYRPIIISYVSDSVRIKNRWNYFYTEVYRGTLSSLEKAIFKFDNCITGKIRIEILNGDNQFLNIDSLSVAGWEYIVIPRITEPANYFLLYGNKDAESPSYDLNYFEDKVPADLNELTLGEEVLNTLSMTPTLKNSILNKWWLWLVVGSIVLTMVVFTWRMINEKNKLTHDDV